MRPHDSRGIYQPCIENALQLCVQYKHPLLLEAHGFGSEGDEHSASDERTDRKTQDSDLGGPKAKRFWQRTLDFGRPARRSGVE